MNPRPKRKRTGVIRVGSSAVLGHIFNPKIDRVIEEMTLNVLPLEKLIPNPSTRRQHGHLKMQHLLATASQATPTKSVKPYA